MLDFFLDLKCFTFICCLLSAFGFCEFGNPDAALRAIRLLHDYEIAEKKLVVKADAKTKEVLEEYKGTDFSSFQSKHNHNT